MADERQQATKSPQLEAEKSRGKDEKEIRMPLGSRGEEILLFFSLFQVLVQKLTWARM
jgi:lipid A disaccharide synthetase